MPKRRKDTATVASVDSSLRNLDYEPSVQESVVDDATHSDGESALSSVLSSVKRSLRKKQQSSVKSNSTSRSEGMFWQDSESEAELYSTSSEEEAAEKPPKKATSKGKQNTKAKTTQRLDHESISTTEGSTHASSDSLSGGAKSRDQSTQSSKSNPQKDATKTTKKPKETKASRQQEPFKRLRFSTQALAEAAQSRINEPRHEMIPKPEPAEGFEILQNVDYLSHLDVATTNQDISTLHPLGKEECNQIFKSQVPFVVPVIQSTSDDDMSSIHGVSIKVAAVKNTQAVELDLESQEEHKTNAPQVKAVETKVAIAEGSGNGGSTEVTKSAGSTDPAVRVRRVLRAWVSDRGGYELFFTTLIGMSLITLIILIAILLGT